MARLDDSRRPRLIPLDRRNKWKLAEGWEFLGFYVPKGFITDLDSIPYIPLIYSILKGRASWSAVLHDYLYCSGETTRKDADELFLMCMKKEGIPKIYRESIFLTLRLFGWIRWNKLRKIDGCDVCGMNADD